MSRGGLTSVLAAFSLLGLSCQTVRPPSAPVQEIQPLEIQLTGEVEHEDLTEISGIAPSRIETNRLWVLNDSGNAPKLYALGTDGSHQGFFVVGGSENRDWEDLASYQEEGKSWLVVGEIGDNDAKYPACRLLFVEEPVKTNGSFPVAVNPQRVMEFTYEDGPRDVEGLAVHPDENRIYLLSKRTQPPVLYQLPLHAPGGEPQVARRVTEVSGVEPPSLAVQMLAPVKGKFSSMPTAMDHDPQGRFSLIMTYRDLYLYHPNRLTGGEAPAFGKPLPYLQQAEAACFSADGQMIYFTSEKRPSPLYRMAVPKP